MTLPQPDLFGATPAPAAAPPRPPAPEIFPTPPTLPWARKLAEREPLPVEFHVSWLWTGEVVEAIARAGHGRWILRKGGEIEEIRADPACAARIIYLDPRRARELHSKRRLIRLGIAGTHSARYRLALPAELAPAELPLPPGCDDV